MGRSQYPGVVEDRWVKTRGFFGLVVKPKEGCDSLDFGLHFVSALLVAAQGL